MRRLLRLLGFLLTVTACIFFAFYAYRSLAHKDVSRLLNGESLGAIATLTVVYMLMTPAVAIAWTWLLRAMRQPVGYRYTMAIMACTQFGKYVPGNVAQYFGRIALVRSKSVRLSVALFSVAYETLLALIASAHVSALTLLWAPPAALSRWAITAYRVPILLGVTACAIAALVLAPRIASWLAVKRATRHGDADDMPPAFTLTFSTAIACYLMYVINFFLIGCGLWLMAHSLLGGAIASTPNLIFLTGAFAGSWILGFVTPGAPAGLGIREAILSAWLSGSMPVEQIVLLVIALRIATTVGDLLNLAWGSAALVLFGHTKPK